MIIARTPFRVSLFGGGTDYPEWFNEHGGCVVGMAIDKYCYVSIRHLPPFFEHRSRIAYTKVETVADNALIEHPAVRGVLAHLNITEGVEIHHDADLPARSGMGSSSSFVVGLLQAGRSLRRIRYLPKTLALDAIQVEREVLGETVGWQDEIWAAMGGLNRIDFNEDSFWVKPIEVSAEREQALTDRLLLVFTGFSRIASQIAKEQVAAISGKRQVLAALQGYAAQAADVIGLAGASLDKLGYMLHNSWLLKKQLTGRISDSSIDAIYDKALKNGALGGKLLGAGGGGFLLFYVEPENRARLRQALEPLITVDFKVDYEGSKIVLHQPEGL